MSFQTAFYQDERCFWHSTGEHALTAPVGWWVQPPAAGGHAESPESKRRMVSLMEVSGLMQSLERLSADPASKEDLLRVHGDAYINQFKRLSDTGGGEIGLYAPFASGGYEIACLSAGLTKQAVDDVLSGKYQNGYSLSRPPGHHCLREKSMGFCLLANIPIAIEAARIKHQVTKIAVVDWDVHHGNGTESIFYDRPDVLTISLHQEGCFPPGSGLTSDTGSGDGEGFNRNIPILPGTGHEGYMYAMDRVVLPLLRQYGPELIIVASGFDANGFDPLGRMLLHADSYREMMGKIMAVADELCSGKVVVVHEGGYSEAYVPFCGQALIEQLAGQTTAVEDPFTGILSTRPPNAAFTNLQKQILNDFAVAYGV